MMTRLFYTLFFVACTVLAVPISHDIDEIAVRDLSDNFVSLALRGDVWGKGKYQIDLSIYHEKVKPKFKTEFQSKYGKKFTDFCGSNPDFMIEKDGMVSASAVKKNDKCSLKNFPALDLGSVVTAAQPPPSRSPSPAPS